MKRIVTRLAAALTALLLLLTCQTAALAASDGLDDLLRGTAQYVYETVASPRPDAVGGEWAVLGLARADYPVADGYYRGYAARLSALLRQKDGVLDSRKYTEYARTVLALTALGVDARNAAGHDLTAPLGNYDKTVWQGINGPVWALIALDSGIYPMPVGATASRERYVRTILDRQNADGGWSPSGTVSDPDMTAMALQALASYTEMSGVGEAVDRALDWMSGVQLADGGFQTAGISTAESCAQAVIALCALGISLEDIRFVKNGNTALDALLSYRLEDGSFRHTAGGAADQMATEQALLALTAARRARDGGAGSLYRVGSVSDGLTDLLGEGKGLPDKDPDVQPVPVTLPGTTFSDITDHRNRAAVEALAARGIINGRGGGLFVPDDSMTRAEFATIVVRGLGLTPAADDAFTDVSGNAWYAPYVGTAHACGIVNGVGGGLFLPGGTITRQEAAAMVARAGRLCGILAVYDDTAARSVLSAYGDYREAASWAREPMAWCLDQGVLTVEGTDLLPGQAIRRCEIAQMLFNLLEISDLL